MTLKKCKKCGAEISSSAKSCPNCGKTQTNNALILIAVVIIVLLSIGIAVSTADSTNSVSSQPEIQNNDKITLEKFNQIQTGMTYQQVVEIIGEEGTLSTESSYSNQTMQIYYWYAKNGISNTTVTFMNGKVTAKSQIGLD